MCCTIYFDRETEEDIRALVKEISDSAAMRSGILRPSDAVTVISGRICAGDSLPGPGHSS